MVPKILVSQRMLFSPGSGPTLLHKAYPKSAGCNIGMSWFVKHSKNSGMEGRPSFPKYPETAAKPRSILTAAQYLGPKLVPNPAKYQLLIPGQFCRFGAPERMAKAKTRLNKRSLDKAKKKKKETARIICQQQAWCLRRAHHHFIMALVLGDTPKEEYLEEDEAVVFCLPTSGVGFTLWVSFTLHLQFLQNHG